MEASLRQISPLAAILLFASLGTVSACWGTPESGALSDAGAKKDVGALLDAGAKKDAGAFSDVGAKKDDGAFSDTWAGPDDGAFSDAWTEPDTGAFSDVWVEPDAGALLDAWAEPDTGAEKDAGSVRDGGGSAVISGKVTTTLATGQTTPVAGAIVEILGASPANSTTTAADGSYSLTAVVPGTYFVRASKDSMISAQLGVVASQQTGAVDLGLLSRANANLMATYLGISLDSSKGIVVVGFETSDTGGGYSASLTAGGDSFAISAGPNSTPQKSTKTFAGGTNALFFMNVSPSTTKVSFAGPSGHSCSAKLPIESYRVDADVVTGISSTCN
jgi:hypothetical protein